MVTCSIIHLNASRLSQISCQLFLQQGRHFYCVLWMCKSSSTRKMLAENEWHPLRVVTSLLFLPKILCKAVASRILLPLDINLDILLVLIKNTCFSYFSFPMKICYKLHPHTCKVNYDLPISIHFHRSERGPITRNKFLTQNLRPDLINVWLTHN